MTNHGIEIRKGLRGCQNPTALACPSERPDPFLPGWYDEARLADLRRSLRDEAARLATGALAAQFASLGATPPPALTALRLVQP